MNTTMLILIVAGVILLFGLWFIITSNQLIAKRNRVKQCRSGICVALKNRNDLIPNLVAAAKTYMEYENRTLTQIVELRTRATELTDERQQIETGNLLSALIPQLRITAEAYPQLQADKQFLNLQDSLDEMERQLQAIRRTYNAAVVDYNNLIEMFPSSWVAHRQKHTQEELIAIPESEQANVDVKQLFS